MEHTAVEKALIVLKAMARSKRPLGPSELAKLVGINKATVNRILIALKKHDFLVQDPESRHYLLGPEAAVLGQAVTQSLDGQIVTLARPHLERLRDLSGQSVHFEVLSGDHFYLAYTAQGPGLVPVAPSVGDQVFPHVHAGSKAIAAFSRPQLIDRWLSGELPSFTEKTITDPLILREQFQKIRESGISSSRGEYNNNVVALGAPVFDHTGDPVAGMVLISLIINGDERPRPEFQALLKETATAVSKSLFSTRTAP